MRAAFTSLPRGDWGTYATLWKMRSLIQRGRWHPLVRRYAVRVVEGVGGHDGFAQAHVIREWLAGVVEFMRDPDGVEALHSPDLMIRQLLTIGPPLSIDCDDAAILAAAVGGAVGLKARLVTVGFLSPRSPFRHVWTELASPAGPYAGRWVDMDVTRSGQMLPDTITRRLVTPV